MKKIVTTLSILAFTGMAANAQAVLGYTLSESEGTYTPLADGTVIYQGTDDAVDANMYDRGVITPEGITVDGSSSKGFDLGFDLNFAGETYTHFLVSTNGYLYLGNGDIAYNTMMRNNYLMYYGDYSIVGFAGANGVGHLDSTEISYKVRGSGDDSVLTVQFSNFGIMTSMWDDNPAPVDVQLVVNAKGEVKYIFNKFGNVEEPAEYKFRLGVRAGENYVTASGEAGELKESYNNVETAIISSDIPDGTTVTWNVPGECVVPSDQPTDLQFVRTSDSLDFSFTPADDANTYLVVYAQGDAKSGIPQDGIEYAEGDELGNGVVAYYGPKTSGTLFNLPAGTSFTFSVYSVGAYGLNGPKYNDTDALTAVISTLPASPGEVSFTSSTLSSITLEVGENGTDDDILVIYNSYCERSNFGDHGLFGELTPETKAGDVFPVPEDFVPAYNFEGAPLPENAGTVAYIGKPGEVVINDLEPSTMYYISVYTRDANGEYTSNPVNTGWSTIIKYPYDGDSYNFPNYQVPYGWEGSEAGEGTIAARDEVFYDRNTMTTTRGTQIIQQRFNLPRGNAATGMKGWLVPAQVEVNERHLTANFDYSIVQAPTRFQTDPYNEWAEGDLLLIQVSTDNGQNWEALTTYDEANHPMQEDVASYNRISADLSDYRGETILVRLYWETYMNPAFGGNMYVDRFSVDQAEFPAVPEVTVGSVTDETAVINWVSQQTDYQLAYSLKDSEEETVVDVKGAMTYTITGLEANTEYRVRVRGVLVDEGSDEETGYSEWSDPVDFTTADYPAVDAPVGLTADVESKGDEGIVILSWDEINVAEKYEVSYRLASSTEWEIVETAETSVEISGLEYNGSYIWKVRAFCTHDRETPSSAQASFTMPDDPNAGVGEIHAGVAVSAKDGKIVVEGAEGKSLNVYAISGIRVASILNASCEEVIELEPGSYIVNIYGRSYKVAVK